MIQITSMYWLTSNWPSFTTVGSQPFRVSSRLTSLQDQRQLMESQTWYRPHGTTTHKVSFSQLCMQCLAMRLTFIYQAFPIKCVNLLPIEQHRSDSCCSTALLICLFVDGNSVFQCILCGCMWGLDRCCSSRVYLSSRVTDPLSSQIWSPSLDNRKSHPPKFLVRYPCCSLHLARWSKDEKDEGSWRTITKRTCNGNHAELVSRISRRSSRREGPKKGAPREAIGCDSEGENTYTESDGWGITGTC